MEYLNHVFIGDCTKELPHIPTGSIDLLLTDPPSGINKNYDVYIDTLKNYHSLMSAFMPEALRIAKCVIFPAGGMNKLQWWYKHYPPRWLMCWYKGSIGRGSPIGFSDWEALLVYGKPNRMMHDYISAPAGFGHYPAYLDHPCIKPETWARKIILGTTNEGDVVCDCFAGTGTVLAAAKNTGRKYVGVELSPKYAAMCMNRLKQLELWAPMAILSHQASFL